MIRLVAAPFVLCFFFLFCFALYQIMRTHTHSTPPLPEPPQLPTIAVVLFSVWCHSMWFGFRPLACSGRGSVLWQLFLLALEFGGPQSITPLSSPHPSPLSSRSPFPAPASLQLISALQAVVTTHHIMTWSRETEALAPCPATHWAHKVATFTFRAQIGPARSHQAEMQGQQLFPVWPPPLCPPPFVLLCPAVTLSPPDFSCTPSPFQKVWHLKGFSLMEVTSYYIYYI